MPRYEKGKEKPPRREVKKVASLPDTFSVGASGALIPQTAPYVYVPASPSVPKVDQKVLCKKLEDELTKALDSFEEKTFDVNGQSRECKGIEFRITQLGRQDVSPGVIESEQKKLEQCNVILETKKIEESRLADLTSRLDEQYRVRCENV